MKKSILLLVFYYSFFIANYSLSQWVQTNVSNAVNISNNINNLVKFENSLFAETKLYIDTVALKYFPLAVGNVYKYHFASSNFYNYDYIVRIFKDTIINSKRYFVTNHSFPAYIGGILSCDSMTGNIYMRNNVGYCSYSPYEQLIDSLCARKGDTTLVCIQYTPQHYCLDTGYSTLFSNLVKKKVFGYNTSETSTSVTYGINFGIIFSSYSDFWGMSTESLIGCYINGILYGDTTLTEVGKISSEFSSSYSLEQNYPNPFNPSTNIKYQISHHSGSSTNNKFVILKVFDVMGREVETLVNEKQSPGTYEVTFDGSNLSSGIYFYRLMTDGFSETKKMILLK
jgi:hypothetical protein